MRTGSRMGTRFPIVIRTDSARFRLRWVVSHSAMLSPGWLVQAMALEKPLMRHWDALARLGSGPWPAQILCAGSGLRLRQMTRWTSAVRASGVCRSADDSAAGRPDPDDERARRDRSRGSRVAHDFAFAGLDVNDVANAVARDVGDLSALSEWVARGTVQIGQTTIAYSRNTMKTGETVVNFWIR